MPNGWLELPIQYMTALLFPVLASEKTVSSASASLSFPLSSPFLSLSFPFPFSFPSHIHRRRYLLGFGTLKHGILSYPVRSCPIVRKSVLYYSTIVYHLPIRPRACVRACMTYPLPLFFLLYLLLFTLQACREGGRVAWPDIRAVFHTCGVGYLYLTFTLCEGWVGVGGGVRESAWRID